MDTENLRDRLAAEQSLTDQSVKGRPLKGRPVKGQPLKGPRKAGPVHQRAGRASHSRAGHSPGRQIRPRRAWPGMRALLGGVLITLAIGGLWWSYTLSNAIPSTQYVVAVTDIAPGAVVSSDHVGLQSIDLPGGISAASFTPADTDDVLGAVAINFIGAGELVSTSDVRPVLVAGATGGVNGGVNGGASNDVQSRYELSIEIELARVLNGQLLAGELVDIIATNGTGTSATTRRIATDAQVLALAEIGEGGLGLGTVAVTLAVVAPETVLEIVAASDQGALTLVRAPLVRPLTDTSDASGGTAPDSAGGGTAPDGDGTAPDGDGGGTATDGAGGTAADGRENV